MRELLRTPDTLLLRLMGRGHVLCDALADFADLPKTGWEQPLVTLMLARVGNELARMTGDASLRKDLQMRYAQLKEQDDNRIRAAEARGEARGEAYASREALRQVIRARGWGLDPTREALIAQTEDVSRLQEWIARATTQDTIEAVFTS
ncbi:MAG: hypothetical protein Q8Q09_15965 [Deltaproteobacteria bacterium]|nr:hypothetical protein [Deltaproteobacteria bacterium]